MHRYFSMPMHAGNPREYAIIALRHAHARRHFARADFYGCKITLPIALRPANTFSASAVCASGKVRSTWEEIFPSAVHFTSFSRLARVFSALLRVHAPQNPPRMSQPFSSARVG